MSTFVLSLSDPRATLDCVGGKGMSLAKLAFAGFPVPDGFHVTTDAYRRFVSANDLQAKIIDALRGVDMAEPSAAEAASGVIGKLFHEADIPADLVSAIAAAYGELCKRRHNAPIRLPVAVRSSATAEDLPGASFAGQQETYLNIIGTDAVLREVKDCWASLWTARAIAYRARQGIAPDSVALAVVVQELVCADAAGVLFSANPVTGNRDEMIITATWGLGEALVGGLVSPDTLTVDKKRGRTIRRDIAEKLVMTVRTESGTSEVPVPDARKTQPVLSGAQVRQLARFGAEIEKLYEMPMDIEWTLASSKFAIVQARPITALPAEPPRWNLPRPKLLMARGSLAEHLPNPVSPLFGTLGLRPVNKATAELGDLIGADLLEADYQYRVLNGYVYFGFLMSAKFMWTMIKATFLNLKYLFLQGRERWLKARETFATAIAAWDAKHVEILSPSELLAGVRALMYAAGKYYTVIQSGTLMAASSSEIIFTNLCRTISRRDDPEAFTLLFGLESVPLQAEKSLFDLGTWIRAHPALRDFTLQLPSTELVLALQAGSTPRGIPAEDWQTFKARFEKHLNAFGHTSYEFDFMNPTPAETPELILDSVKVYVDGKGSDPYVRQREAAEKRDQTLGKIRTRFKLIPNRWFNAVCKWAMDSGPAREDSLADMGMGHTTVRRLLGELGKRFVEGGALDNARDIYWLLENEVDELASMLERREPLPDYGGRVPARKSAWGQQMQLVPPAVLPVTSRWNKLFPWARENPSRNVIKGLGASTGRATGTARVIFAPEDFSRMKPGNVLVAVTTTPAWTPLFTMASAVVTDIGGPLSHSSIVAREYGIPAVLATGNGTRRIHDGQAITVDGTRGEVVLDTAEGVRGAQSAALEWPLPHPKAVMARGSFAEFVPEPVSPLFATLAVPIARDATLKLMYSLGVTEPNSYIFSVINDYVYVGFLFTPRMAWMMIKTSVALTSWVIKSAQARREAARAGCVAAVEKWRSRELKELTPSELMEGATEIFIATTQVYNVAQSGAIPGAMLAETIFAKFYDLLVKRKGDPQACKFLFGLENHAMRSEKALYDVATWAKAQPELGSYLSRTSAHEIGAALASDPGPVPALGEFSDRFHAYLQQYGHVIYDLDFSKPVPAEDPVPLLETLKVYLAGRNSPYERQHAAQALREQATASIIGRLDPLRRKYFLKLLKTAQDTAPLREDSIADLGIGYLQMRRMLGELGRRLTAGGAIACANDVYWLELQELQALAAQIEEGEALRSLETEVERRKAKWQAMRSITPPSTLPKISWMKAFFPGGDGTGPTLKGFAASAGSVTARACVMLGPEDFDKMQPGDVIVAGITTPAWTPLFARAAGIVTDIGGPLSHSSIVAREYGIPAVLATGSGTRRIKDGQTITVDGSAGVVTLGAV